MKQPLLLILIFSCMHLESAKIVGLVAVRNEELLIEQCLRGLAVYTDEIIVLDDASEDCTLDIMYNLVDECNITKILSKKRWHRDESGDRNHLLEAGRKQGGTHFVVLDADELFTANCADNNALRNKILEMQPGDSLFFHWIRLWKDVHIFKAADIELKQFIFCDNGTSTYPTRYIHSQRIPADLDGNLTDFGHYETYGVLHFQAVNWRNMLLRQAWYQCLERIRLPLVDPQRIANLYSKPIDETDLKRAYCPSEWFAYDFFNEQAYYVPDTWREQQIESWINEYGKDYFKDLAIWDIGWQFDCDN